MKRTYFILIRLFTNDADLTPDILAAIAENGGVVKTSGFDRYLYFMAIAFSSKRKRQNAARVLESRKIPFVFPEFALCIGGAK